MQQLSWALLSHREGPRAVLASQLMAVLKYRGDYIADHMGERKQCSNLAERNNFKWQFGVRACGGFDLTKFTVMGLAGWCFLRSAKLCLSWHGHFVVLRAVFGAFEFNFPV